MTIFQHHPYSIKIPALMMISLLVWLICITTSYGVADIFAKQANDEMQQWATQKITMEIWISTQAMLEKALQLDSQKPDLLEMMGTLYYWKAQKVSLTFPDKITASKDALDYFLQATKKRPTSALTWANVLRIKNFLTQYDDTQYDAQFLRALKQATIQAPNNSFVHRVVADIGLSSWQQLPKKEQSVVLMTIERGLLGTEAKQIENLIKKYRHDSVICQYNQQYQNISTIICKNTNHFE